MPSLVHEYHAELTWTGSTREGLAGYDRTHRLRMPPADAELVLTSDPAFRGDAQLLNPEQLLTAAVSSCQMLTFLTLAAQAGLDVLSYRDSAVARMPIRLSRIDSVVLHPLIAVRGPAEPAEVVALVERAHRQCFIARSLNAEIAIHSQIDVVEASVTL